jgi:hypothetical protein
MANNIEETARLRHGENKAKMAAAANGAIGGMKTKVAGRPGGVWQYRSSISVKASRNRGEMAAAAKLVAKENLSGVAAWRVAKAAREMAAKWPAASISAENGGTAKMAMAK